MAKYIGKNGVNDVLKGTSVSDTFYGLSGNDTIYGYGGVDLIYAGAGNDRLNGGHGADLMQGGSGNDVYFVDSALDDTIESAGGGIDKVVSSITTSLQDNVENLQLTGLRNINGKGNELANIIIGNAGNNRLYGGGGKDAFAGGNGVDKFVYKSASDSGTAIDDSESDVIRDFTHGKDKIDLSMIDAISHTGANNSFRFIGTANFTNDVAVPPAHFAEVRFNYDGSTKMTLVIVNIESAAPTVDTGTGHTLSGDTTPDMQIFLKGNVPLTAADFIL
jgi:Ca2+-binding RTX toxin-like protein